MPLYLLIDDENKVVSNVRDLDTAPVAPTDHKWAIYPDTLNEDDPAPLGRKVVVDDAALDNPNITGFTADSRGAIDVNAALTQADRDRGYVNAMRVAWLQHDTHMAASGNWAGAAISNLHQDLADDGNVDNWRWYHMVCSAWMYDIFWTAHYLWENTANITDEQKQKIVQFCHDLDNARSVFDSNPIFTSAAHAWALAARTLAPQTLWEDWYSFDANWGMIRHDDYQTEFTAYQDSDGVSLLSVGLNSGTNGFDYREAAIAADTSLTEEQKDALRDDPAYGKFGRQFRYVVLPSRTRDAFPVFTISS